MDGEVRGAPSLSERLYARLLAVYPRGYRREYGSLMLQLFRDQYRDARRQGGRWAGWRLWWRIATELAETAGQEHLAAIEEAWMDKQTGRLNANVGRPLGIIVASVLIAGSLIGKVLIFEFGGSTALALAVLLTGHLIGGLVIDRMLNARGTAFMLMALLTCATLLPMLWVGDPRAWLRENPLVGGVFIILLAGYYQPGRTLRPLYLVAGILAAAQIAVSFF
jgi:hypothetical protein